MIPVEHRGTKCWLSILVAVALMVVITGFLIPVFIGPTAHWVGHAELQLDIRVKRKDTGEPITSATVVLREAEFGDLQKWPVDQKGKAVISMEQKVAGSKGPGIDSAVIDLPDTSIHATAEGYLPSKPAVISRMDQPKRPLTGVPWQLPVTILLQPEHGRSHSFIGED